MIISRTKGPFIINFIVVASFWTLISTVTSDLTNDETAKAKSPLGIYPRAAVAADNGRCSEIGASILKRGGNAVESVIATAICIGVMDPHSAGLGGGHFLTIYNKTTKSCVIFDARESAPLGTNEKVFQNNTKLARKGWLAIAVPGELHGLWTAYKRYGGNIPWKDLWTPTIDICRKGMKISQAVAKVMKENAAQVLKESPDFKDFLHSETGELKVEGDEIKFPKLADTMEKIANSGDPVKLFYDSDWTEEMIREITANGGIITREDMRNYTTRFGPTERPPIYTRLRKDNLTFCSPPPPSSGSLTTSIISVLDAFNMSSVDKTNRTGVALLYHRFLEATKFAYGVRNKLGDMDFVDSSYSSAASANYRSYANYISKKVGPKSMKDPIFYGAASVTWDHGTAHMSVVDQYGNAASLTGSINYYFGARVRSNVTGIIYNNEMDDFSVKSAANYFEIEPTPENRMEPGKRPQSSMGPLIAFDERTGDVRLTLGAAGGVKIIAATAQVIMRLLYLNNETLKQAIDEPRIYNQLLPYNSTFEAGFSQDTLKQLEANYGQLVDPKVHPFFSVVCGIRRLPNGLLEANSDYRKGGGYTAGF